jgi:hypothetical protein
MARKIFDLIVILFHLFITFVLAVLILGCGDSAQSGEAIYANDSVITLITGVPNHNDWRMDIYYGPNPPNDLQWNCMGFAFGVILKDIEKKSIRREGIRIDVRLKWSSTFMEYVGDNVFSDGRGFVDFTTGVDSIIEDATGVWHCTRTNNNGETTILIGAGDSGFIHNSNHQGNPELYIKEEDWISTIAEFELRIRKNGSAPILKDFHVVFVKTEGQHFWADGIPGVYDLSYSAIGSWSRTSSNSAIDDYGVTILPVDFLEEGIAGCSELIPKGFNQPPPPFECGEQSSLPATPNTTAPASFFTVNDAYWGQLIFVDDYGWGWIDVIPSSFSPYTFFEDDIPWQGEKPCSDPNSSDMKLQNLLDWSQPVVHYVDVSFTEPVEPFIASCVLRVLPHEPYFYPDPNYWPENEPAQEADFNFDGKINLLDFSKLSNCWLDEFIPSDPNSTIPPLDKNGDYLIGIYELCLLSEYWTKNNNEYVNLNYKDCYYSQPFLYQTVDMTEVKDRHLLATPFILQTNDERFEGWYEDSYGNPIYWAYTPPGAIIDIRPVENGDYNGDGITNLKDFSIFYNMFGSYSNDPAFDYDNNGEINQYDFQQWMSFWLKQN